MIRLLYNAATLSALAIPENQSNYKSDLKKASMKLGKIPKVEEIRSLVEKKKQKHDADMYVYQLLFYIGSITFEAVFPNLN